MKEIDAKGILEIVAYGTTATLLARRWKSDRLVNVDDNTLTRILNDKKAMEILSKLRGFRNINEDISTIIKHENKIQSIRDFFKSKEKKD